MSYKSRCKRLMRVVALAAVFWLMGAGAARADSCSGTMTDIVFANVSPIAGADSYASGTLTVSCTWGLLTGIPPQLLFPNASICVNLGLGTGGVQGQWRTMTGGTGRLPFNLYRDSSYAAASVWGSPSTPGSPTGLNLNMSAGLLSLGTQTATFTIYGKIPGNALGGVGTVGNVDTVFSSDFSGEAIINYAFWSLVSSPCTAGASATVPFRVRATVINNCVINASNLAFGASTVLTGTVRANAALSVQCTANNAYRISLNGGLNGTVAARRMRNPSTGEMVLYAISGTPDGPVWGDGSLGTSMVTGTGTGAVQSVPIFGSVPKQTTPSPGDYKDTVTATIYF
ncbi:spore coat U domain-containing protein [Massilia sp. YIM B02769]|nr:spore coat U domain-containing protein [Massilia sp. YIM B02769]MDN4058445.1 spore coat U domain-containing protein [Massilia sp. YIM B02769]